MGEPYRPFLAPFRKQLIKLLQKLSVYQHIVTDKVFEKLAVSLSTSCIAAQPFWKTLHTKRAITKSGR